MRTMLVALAAAAWLAGCDERRAEKLEEGLSTEADVRRVFGTPTGEWDEAGGARVLEYARQPEGQTNYLITIGPDGRMSALRQVLKEADFAKVQPGMSRDQVRRLLGRPAERQSFELRREEVWDWRYAGGGEKRVFRVTFDDTSGQVLRSASIVDPRELYQQR